MITQVFERFFTYRIAPEMLYLPTYCSRRTAWLGPGSTVLGALLPDR